MSRLPVWWPSSDPESLAARAGEPEAAAAFAAWKPHESPVDARIPAEADEESDETCYDASLAWRYRQGLR